MSLILLHRIANLERELKEQDANHAIQLLEKDKEINHLQGQLLIEIKANENLRLELHKYS